MVPRKSKELDKDSNKTEHSCSKSRDPVNSTAVTPLKTPPTKKRTGNKKAAGTPDVDTMTPPSAASNCSKTSAVQKLVDDQLKFLDSPANKPMHHKKGKAVCKLSTRGTWG